MLISALCDYCDILEDKGKLPPVGYQELGISYLVSLNLDGSLNTISDCREKRISDVRGKQRESYDAKKLLFPKRSNKPSISTDYVEVRGGYLFGLEFIKKENGEEILSTESSGKTEKTRKKVSLQHKNFVEEVRKDFSNISKPSAIVRAYIRFAETWNPDEETSNRLLIPLGRDLNANFAFCLAGHPELLLQNDKGVQEQWNILMNQKQPSESAQCAITGRLLPVAKTHDTLKGIKEAGTNSRLVTFKPEAFDSYGHHQGTNACISDYAMKKYTRALNWLLDDSKHHYYLDGLTIVYWAADGNNSDDDIMNMLLGNNQGDSDDVQQMLNNLIRDTGQTEITADRLQEFNDHISANTYYYIVALAPNSSRIQVKFIYRQKFGNLITNIVKFQNEIQITGLKHSVPLWMMKNELVSPNSSHPEGQDVKFLAVLRSILQGTDYPSWFLSTVILRISKDRDSSTDDVEKKNDDVKKKKRKRLNPVRAGIIKACITRHTKEALTMSLDKDNDNQAYLCGRLFAVLQEIQEHASPSNKLNRTIVDTYFSSASSNPAVVMPKLLKLSQHHMAKLKRDKPKLWVNDGKQMDDIIKRIGVEFPSTLNLYDQGRFILGYYHQNISRFESKEGENKNVGA